MTAPTSSVPPRPAPVSEPVPPLKHGDRLTRAEFERRYDAMPGLKKAELIEGVVYMPSPVRLGHHAEPQLELGGWLLMYKALTPGVRSAINATIRLDLQNEPQPDALLLIDPARGGQARISDDDYVKDAPELVAEVSASTTGFDLNAKLEAYRRNRVREYLVWRVEAVTLDWLVWRNGRFEPLAPGPDGLLRSEVFPGLWLDAAALLRGDSLTMLDTVRRGCATPEHAAFVAHLAAAQPQ